LVIAPYTVIDGSKFLLRARADFFHGTVHSEGHEMPQTGTQPELIERTNGLWVLSKPAGWVVHPTHDPTLPDLIAWCQQHLDAPPELAPINRIDRETSGVVLYAADPKIRATIGAMFADNEVKKTYRALVYGNPPHNGVIDVPLDDGRRGRPLDALTRYEVLETFVSCAHLAVFPETGRKHQIRRHLLSIGHAIVGDRRYTPRRRPNVAGFPGRMWLHAHTVKLADGREFVAPLPRELEDQLVLLRSLEREREDQDRPSGK
jgi:tRNA pseudouridine65 synthase